MENLQTLISFGINGIVLFLAGGFYLTTKSNIKSLKETNVIQYKKIEKLEDKLDTKVSEIGGKIDTLRSDITKQFSDLSQTILNLKN